MRSRVLALTAVAFLGSTPIGSPITGWIADHISAEWSLAYGSILSIAIALIAGLILTRPRTLEDDRAHSADERVAVDPVVPA
jgi:predicted MFS family arabinose efflux permease